MSTAALVPASDPLALCHQSIAHHSKSFALASKVLPRAQRDSAAMLYAWCRYVDDAVDLVPTGQQARALEHLRRELDQIYSDQPIAAPIPASFQQLVRKYRIPRAYPQELIEGMAMDVGGHRYSSIDELLRYCYRVASTVGLMMCHIMGLADVRALRNAAHLGIAMQLTNICRDVAEDWQRGRLYIPDDLLARAGANDLRSHVGKPLPASAHQPLAAAVDQLLDQADRYYRSGDRGVPALPWRSGVAVRAARAIYSAIGDQLRRRHCDIDAGRAIVPLWRKILLLGKAGLRSLVDVPLRLLAAPRRAYVTPDFQLRFPRDVLPL